MGLSVGLSNVMLSSIKSLFDSVATDTNLGSNADLTRKVSVVLMIEVALSMVILTRLRESNSFQRSQKSGSYQGP